MEPSYGNYRGVVKQSDGKTGFCKIFVPSIYPSDFNEMPEKLPNAEPAMPLANGNSPGVLDSPPANISIFLDASGDHCVPEVGARVWVFFEGGNTKYPVYFASIPVADTWVSEGSGIVTKNTKSVKIKIDESALIQAKSDINPNKITNETEEADAGIVPPVSFDTSGGNPLSDMLNVLGIGDIVSQISSQVASAAAKTQNKLDKLKLEMPDIELPTLPDLSSLVPDNMLDIYAADLTISAIESNLAGNLPNLSDQLDNIASMKEAGWAGIAAEDSGLQAMAGLVPVLSALPALLTQLLGINITCTTDEQGKVKTLITYNGDITFVQFGDLNTVNVGAKNNLQVGDTMDLSLGSLLNFHTGGGLMNQWPLMGI